MEDQVSFNSPRRTLSYSRNRGATFSVFEADNKASGVGVSGEHGPNPSEVYGFVGAISTVVATEKERKKLETLEKRMGEDESWRRIDVWKVSDDLVDFLKDKKDMNLLNHCVDRSNGLRSTCLSDNAGLHTALQGYHKKIDACKQKIEAAKAEVASDVEIHLLEKELDDEIQREALLRKDLRALTSQIRDLEEQRSHIEERRQVLKKLEQDEMKTQMKLSMYASVTNIIPDLNEQSKIAGHIVDKHKEVVEKFEFNSQEISDFDACNAIWKMIVG